MATSTTNLKLSKLDSSDYVGVDTFNENYDLLDKLGVDYITARGTASGWYYRKWKSGWAEAWYKKTGTTTSAEYYNAKVTMPFAFSSNPHVQASGGVTGKINTNIMYANIDGNNKALVDVYINTPSVKSGLSWWIDIYVAGQI